MRQKFVLDAQAVLLNFRRPVAAREQRDVLPGAEEVSREVAAEHARAKYQNLHV